MTASPYCHQIECGRVWSLSLSLYFSTWSNFLRWGWPESGWGEFILSAWDSARPRYHSSLPKLLLFHLSSNFFSNFSSYFFFHSSSNFLSISPHISLRLVIILLSPNYVFSISSHIFMTAFFFFENWEKWQKESTFAIRLIGMFIVIKMYMYRWQII